MAKIETMGCIEEITRGGLVIVYPRNFTAYQALGDAFQVTARYNKIVTFSWNLWKVPMQVTVMRHSVFQTIYDWMIHADNGACEPYVGP